MTTAAADQEGRRKQEDDMRKIAGKMAIIIAGAAALMMGGVGATAAELPTYEVMGFPITPHQLVALGPADAQQGLPALTLTKAGMPASLHQIAVLTPRQRPTEQIASSGERMATGLARSSRVVVGEQAR